MITTPEPPVDASGIDVATECSLRCWPLLAPISPRVEATSGIAPRRATPGPHDVAPLAASHCRGYSRVGEQHPSPAQPQSPVLLSRMVGPHCDLLNSVVMIVRCSSTAFAPCCDGNTGRSQVWIPQPSPHPSSALRACCDGIQHAHVRRLGLLLPPLLPSAPAPACVSSLDMRSACVEHCRGLCIELPMQREGASVWSWLAPAPESPGRERGCCGTAGPPPMWLIGNLLDVLRMSFPKAAQHWRKQYGPVFKVTPMCSPAAGTRAQPFFRARHARCVVHAARRAGTSPLNYPSHPSGIDSISRPCPYRVRIGLACELLYDRLTG